ncbi:hypothetical protein [uncultured Holdemanella sp.]|uniref:hypothetical protein n=1 Tax=uncultured Holdemanella sp. TaxID=1763549 RepID=UPI0025D9BB02|nr:hypothetical protein [uncultured Holdemanella sp.]
MIWMQDVAYTDYIYWQETNSFINGVASSSQNIELFFDEKVDLDSSLVIYDGKQVDLSQEHTYIDVQKEGVTQLVYILKDVDGYALDQGEKSILLDTTIPDVVVKAKDHNIMDVLPLENKETIHVEILEENIESIEVYLDDEKLDCEGKEFDLDVTNQNHILRILCRDVAGNEVERKIDILPIVFPECELKETLYTKENKMDLKFDGICETPFYLKVYCDENFCYSLDLENLDSITVDFTSNGTYTFVLEHKEYPQIKKALEGSIVYSNIQPIITLQPSSKVSNEDVLVGLNWYVPYIKKAYVDVELDGIKDRHPFNEEICLKAVENKDLFYKIFAYAMDAFGNEVTDMVIVRIDKRAPSTSLYLNNEQVLDKKIIKKSPKFDFLKDDNSANMRVEYYINGVLMDMDLEKVFNRMLKNDVLKVKTYTTDALSNLEIKEYEFVFSPDKKIEMVSKSEQILRSDQVATFERIWSVNEKNELVLEKNTKVLTSKLKPKIHYVRKKNKVQIYSEDQIESCLVNGKKVEISKDVLGHDFVEISLRKSKTTIEVKAKNDTGVTTIKKSEVKKQAIKKTFMYKLWIWIKRFFKL